MTNEQLMKNIIERIQSIDADDRGEWSAGCAYAVERAEEVVCEEFAKIEGEQAIVAPLVARAITIIVGVEEMVAAGKMGPEEANSRAGAFFHKDTVIAIARALKKLVDGRPLYYVEWKSGRDPDFEAIKTSGDEVLVRFHDKDNLTTSLVRWCNGAWVREDGSICTGLAVLYFPVPKGV